MYAECEKYLKEHLKSAGVRTEIFTEQKRLANNNDPRKGAVIADGEELTQTYSKVIFVDADGRKHKRVKTYDRKLTFIVTIGEHRREPCVEIYEKFLRELDEGIYIDGNYMPIAMEPANWYDEEDRIINSKIAVVFKVSFDGGVYKDTSYLKVGIDVTSPEMESVSDVGAQETERGKDEQHKKS